MFRRVLLVSTYFILFTVNAKEIKTEPEITYTDKPKIINEPKTIIKPKVKEVPKVKIDEEPKIKTEPKEFKSYMDFRAITNKNSKQYKLQQQAYTDKGFRKINSKYLIALGSYYGEVGDEVIVLIGETKLECIIGDIKADKHTDKENKRHLSDNSVIEFIVDTNTLENIVKKMGDCSYTTHINIRDKVLEIRNANT